MAAAGEKISKRKLGSEAHMAAGSRLLLLFFVLERLVLLPVATAEEIEADESENTMNNGCLRNFSLSELRTLTYKDKSYVFPLGVGVWHSAATVGEVLRILMEEVLKVRTVVRYHVSVTDSLKHVLGCEDENGQLWDSNSEDEEVQRKAQCDDPSTFQDPPQLSWCSIEIWTGASSSQRLLARAGPTSSMGYRTMPGLYTQWGTVERGQALGIHLKWWQEYQQGLEWPGFDIFSTVAELESAMSNLSTDGLPRTIRPLCDPLNPTDDHRTYMSLLEDRDIICEDGWWYSPNCTDHRDHCVPVVLGELNWNFIEWCESLRKMGLPVAVTWVGWGNGVDVVRRLPNHHFLFYWWEPDSTFASLSPHPPEQVFFDDRFLSIPQVQSPELVPWTGLNSVDPTVYLFLRTISLSDDDLSRMMLRRSLGHSVYDIACDWLRDPENEVQWQGWIPQLENLSSGGETVVVEDLSVITLMIVIGSTLVGVLLMFLIWLIVRKRLKLLRDSPDDTATASGSWVAKWLSPHIHLCLTESTGHGGRAWLVNASPFTLSVNAVHGRTQLKLEPFSFCRSAQDLPFGHIIIKVSAPEVPLQPWHTDFKGKILEFQIESSEWSFTPSDVDCKSGCEPVRYLDAVVRKHLYGDDTDNLRSQVKLTRSTTGHILVQWSPPHTLRGIPIGEFEHFLNRVIDHPKTWERCASFSVDGDMTLVDKGPRCNMRNMYDANKFIVRPEAAMVDASYAEVKTQYGPANLFISHVWAETAEITRDAIGKLYHWQRENYSRSHTAVTEGCISETDHYRVWFCTLCNNQSRLVEELGSDVYYSPFATVLRSPNCERVALVSPFRALNRKWCNYEFCISRSEKKHVVMLTNDGVVQAGHVSPSTLRALADKVMGFDCRKATCTNASDEAFIDQAVDRMGGYPQLTSTLQDVFRAAIFSAFQRLQEAVEKIGTPEDTHDLYGLVGSGSSQVDSPLSQDYTRCSAGVSRSASCLNIQITSQAQEWAPTSPAGAGLATLPEALPRPKCSRGLQQASWCGTMSVSEAFPAAPH